MVGEVAVFGLIHKIAVAVAHLHQVIIHHLRSVKQALLLLPLGAGTQQLAAAAGSGAAGDPLLFNDDDLRPGKLCLNGGGKAAGTGAADHHVKGSYLVLIVRCLGTGGSLDLRQRLLAGAGSLQRGRDGLQNGGGRQVRAYHGGDIQRLIFNDQSGKQLHGGCVQAPADAPVFLVLGDLHLLDAILRHGYTCKELAAIAAAAALVGSGIEFCHFTILL